MIKEPPSVPFMFVARKKTVQTYKDKNVTCNLKPLAFPWIATFYQFLRTISCNSDLTFLTLGKKT